MNHEAKRCKYCDNFFTPITYNNIKCSDCKADFVVEKLYREQNREAIKIRQRSKRKLRYVEWTKRNPEKVHLINKRWNLRTKYGLTLEQYSEMISQGCSICGKKEETALLKGKKLSLSVDHCHKTNKVRGILCKNCNNILGQAQDNIEILEKAINYLKEKN